MATLLLRLAAPLQAWGINSKFETRNTEREPSKSGVIGLLAAALGYKRYESDKLDELNKLHFGVRTDREGKLLRDFHTAKAKTEKNPYVTNRYYLSDAVFLVGIEGDHEQLEELTYALSHPAYPLFLGRRSCPPTLPLCLGIRELPLIDALKSEPSLVKNPHGPMRLTLDADTNSKSVAAKQDIPRSFDPRRREYGYRGVTEQILHFEKSETVTSAEHDPFEELEDI